MIPRLLQATEDSAASPLARHTPPLGFCPAEGVRSAYLVVGGEVGPGSLRAPASRTAAQKSGLRYEAKVHKYLAGIFGPAYRQSPWIHFLDDSGGRRCQPDGLIWHPDFTVVVEVKIRHMVSAWWQLCRLYLPVVTVLRPDKPVALLTIVRSYDPSVLWPEPPNLAPNIEAVLKYRGVSDHAWVLEWVP